MMKFGICLPIRRDTSLEFNVELGVRAESLGFDSVWASDHIAVPNKQVGRFTQYFYDPFILLSAISSETSKIKIGTSLIILPYRNPVIVANMVSSLDILSKGRFIFGVATGWLKEEFDILSIPFRKRGKRTNEYLEVIKELWENDDPVYKGEYFSFSDFKFDPKPYQKPHPDIWVGGNSDYAIERAVRYGSGWQPTWVTPNEMGQLIDQMNKLVDPDNFVYSVRNRVTISDKKDCRHPDCYFNGTPCDIIKIIKDYEREGVSHILFDPETDGDQETFEMIETLSKEVIIEFS